MEKIITRIGSISAELDVFNLKDVLVKNDAGDWGDEPKEDAIGIIRSTNFTNEGKLNLKDVAYRNLKPNKRLEKKLFENEILIERSGGSETQPVGRVGLVTNEIGRSDFAFANFIQRIALNETVAPTYVYYCLQQMYEMGVTRAMQYQTTGIRNLDWKLYIKSVLPKPPKPEQTAIATILSKLDEAIAATQNSIKAAEKLKKSLMQNLLSGKLKPDGSWRTDDEFYVDEKFGKVPVGWEVARVKDYGFVQTGKTPPTAESNVFSEIENELRYPFITPGDLGESKYVSTSERFVTEKGIRYSYKLPINSICVVCIGSTIGKIGITKTEACTNQQINALIANENNSGEFFFYMMEYRKPHFKEIAGINATPQINKSGFIKYKLLRPKEKSEQEEIVSQLNSFDEENITKQSKIRTLQRLKKSLMQNLLTGKVRLDVEKVNNILSEQ